MWGGGLKVVTRDYFTSLHIKQNRIANLKVLARKMHELKKYEAKNSEKDLEEKLQRHSRNAMALIPPRFNC